MWLSIAWRLSASSRLVTLTYRSSKQYLLRLALNSRAQRASYTSACLLSQSAAVEALASGQIQADRIAVHLSQRTIIIGQHTVKVCRGGWFSFLFWFIESKSLTSCSCLPASDSCNILCVQATCTRHGAADTAFIGCLQLSKPGIAGR